MNSPGVNYNPPPPEAKGGGELLELLFNVYKMYHAHGFFGEPVEWAFIGIWAFVRINTVYIFKLFLYRLIRF